MALYLLMSYKHFRRKSVVEIRKLELDMYRRQGLNSIIRRCLISFGLPIRYALGLNKTESFLNDRNRTSFERLVKEYIRLRDLKRIAIFTQFVTTYIETGVITEQHCELEDILQARRSAVSFCFQIHHTAVTLWINIFI